MGNAIATKAMASPLRHPGALSLLHNRPILSLSGKLEPNTPLFRVGQAFPLPCRWKHTLAAAPAVDPSRSTFRRSKLRSNSPPPRPKASEKFDTASATSSSSYYPQGQVDSPLDWPVPTPEPEKDRGQENPTAAEDSLPRPDSIEYSKDLVNCIQMIGTLASEVEVSRLDGGPTVALAHIKVPRKRRNVMEEMWFQVEFWNDVAEVAATHLKKSDQIFVSGRVVSESYIDKDNITKMKFKVVAKDLKFVSGGIQIDVDAKSSAKGMATGRYHTSVSKSDYFEAPSLDRDTVKGSKSSWGSKYQSADSSSTSARSTGSEPNIEEMWKDVFKNRSNWWDNRSTKVNSRLPDFKHKSTGKALWITSKYTPAWVHSKLEQLS